MQNIYVVTHAQSQHQIENRVGGWFDTGLTELGRTQAKAVAERLKIMMGSNHTHLISSDLKRAVETANIIGQSLELAVSVEQAFRENSYGVAEGKPQSWLDECIVVAPDDNRLDHKVITGAESKREFVTRIYGAMSRLPDDADVILVTHGYALTFVIASWIGLPLETTGYVNFAASPAGLTHLKADDFFKNRAVKFLNDTAHLSSLSV